MGKVVFEAKTFNNTIKSKKIKISKLNSFELLNLDVHFKIYINENIFFDEPDFPILEFISTVYQWLLNVDKTVDMLYNSMESQENPLITFEHHDIGGYKIYSKWQMFSSEDIFTKDELATAFEDLIKELGFDISM